MHHSTKDRLWGARLAEDDLGIVTGMAWMQVLPDALLRSFNPFNVHVRGDTLDESQLQCARRREQCEARTPATKHLPKVCAHLPGNEKLHGQFFDGAQGGSLPMSKQVFTADEVQVTNRLMEI